jgi:hypothetical protein
MKFKNPQSIIFWNMKQYDVRRATATRHNVKQPEQTKEFKQLEQEFNTGKIESFGWSVWRPGPGQDPNVKPGTPVISIL